MNLIPGQHGREEGASLGERRLPLARRRREVRLAARRRIAAWAKSAPARAPQATSPVSASAARAQRLRAVAGLLGSAFLHGGVVTLAAFASVGRGREPVPARAVTIEVRTRAAPDAKPAAVSPSPPQRVDASPRRKVVARAVEPSSAPEDPPRRAPVIGISFEATVEGGAGAPFAVGESRAGETAPRATEKAPPIEAAHANRVASHLPGTGTSFVPPRRKSPSRAPYPETLKAQGVEGDVTVSVSLSASGRVERVVIVSPAPFEEMNESARRAARAEEFEPATRDGIPIPYTVSFTFRFRLEEP
jgi:TonB family protein